MPLTRLLSPPAALLLAVAILSLAPAPARANPSGERVVAGAAGFERTGSNLTVRQGSDRAIIDWQSFSIGAGSQTTFLQPSSTSATLNRVTGSDLSAIHGTLKANGKIYLINPNGILVGPTGVVNTAGFVASTLDVSNAEFLAGGDMTFRGKGSTASVTNLGSISADGGDLFLIARRVENRGELRARNGTVGLAAGTEVLVKASGEERLFIQAASEPGSVENRGLVEGASAELKAAGGNEYALAINNAGTVRATGVSKGGGRVFLSAGGKSRVVNSGTISARRSDGSGGRIQVEAAQIEMTASAVVDASADAPPSGVAGADGGTVLVGGGLRGQDASIGNAERLVIDDGATIRADGAGMGAGGEVVLWADGRTEFGGSISARGGSEGGAGGFAEVSGKGTLIFRGLVDTGGGTLLLDPTDLTVHATDDDLNTISVGTINNQLVNNSVLLEADNLITWNGDATLDFINPVARTLTLQAGNNIIFHSGATISPDPLAGALSVVLNSDRNASGSGNIQLIGTTILSNGGAITLGGGMNPLTTAAMGSLAGTQQERAGVYLSGATLNSGAGALSVRGTGGSGAVATNRGVWITNDSVITSGGGDVAVYGTGGGDSSGMSSGNVGVFVSFNGRITAGGAGTVSVTGLGGNTVGNGSSNHGIWITNAAIITSGGGSVAVHGTGGGAGTGVGNAGVYVNSSARITAGGAGTVSVTGLGGDFVGTGTSSRGVWISGDNSAITSGGGDVAVNGTGGLAISGSGRVGVFVNFNGQITSGGAGTVSVTGTGTSNTPALLLENSGSISSGSNAAVTITADSVGIDGTGSISSGTGTTTIRTRTAGTQINLGGADVLTGSPLVLGLTSDELDRITAGTLVIGRNDIASGTITVSSAINPANATALEIITARNIVVNANVTGGSGGLTLSSNQQAAATSGDFIGVDTSANLTTSGTLTVLGRGGDWHNDQVGVLVSGGAVVSGIATTVTGFGGASFSDGNHGVRVTGAGSRITSSGGAVLVEGTSGTGSSDNYGVFVDSGGVVRSEGTDASATVSVMGQSRGSGFFNHGVHVRGALSAIDSSGGAVLVEGISSTSASTFNYGVLVGSGGTITNSGTGSGATVAVKGEGKPTGGSTNHGVVVDGAASAITSSGGAVAIEGIGGGFNSFAVLMDDGGSITSGGNAAVTVTADSVNIIGTTPSISSGTGTTTIRTRTAGTQINLGGADVLTGSPLVLGLTSDELDRITSGTLIIGRNDIASSTITVSSAIAPASATALEIVTARNIVVNANLTGGAGGLTLSANQQATSTVANFAGVSVQNGAVVSASGNGAVTVIGRGGRGVGGGSNNFGVYVTGAGSQITSSGGAVLVDGTGSGTTTNVHASHGNIGVYLHNGGVITSAGVTADATVTVKGQGGNQTDASHPPDSGDPGGNDGVRITGTDSRISSSGGDVLVEGTGASGVYDVANHGVHVGEGGSITSTGTAAVTVKGQGGNGQVGGHVGVRVAGASSRITSGGGAVLVEGTGGGGFGDATHGVLVADAGEITSAGAAAAVTVQGIAGQVGIGVYVAKQDSRITSGGGEVFVEASGSSFFEAVRLEDTGSITSGSNANITITADSVNFTGSTLGFINSGTGTTTIRTRTAGTQIDLGGADVLTGSPLVLGLTSDELNRISAGTIIIGADGSTEYPGVVGGTVRVSAALEHAGDNDFVVVGARDIAFSSGASWTTTNGDLTFRANQQATAGTGLFFGIFLDGATITTSGTGNLLLSGRGGSLASSTGIRLVNSAVIQSTAITNGGTINLSGIGQTAGNTHAVFVNSSSQVTSVSGAIQVTGTTTGNDSDGVLLTNGGRIRSTGTGPDAATIDIVGAGTIHGIRLLVGANSVTTVDGAVNLTGTASGGVDIAMVSGGGMQSTGTGAVTLTGNSMEIANLSAGTATVTLQTRTAGTQIDLGGGNAAGILGLTNEELNQITADTLVIGRNDIASGAITVSTPIAPSGTSTLRLITPSNLGINGVLNLGANNLALMIGGGTTQTASITSGSLRLGGNGAFVLENAGNSIGTLSKDGTGLLSLRNSGPLTVGTVDGVAGITASGVELRVDTGNLTLNQAITATGTGNSVVASTPAAFINNFGAAAVNAGPGRWLVYSDAPAGNTFGGLLSGNRALYNRTFAANPPASVTETGNRYLFASTVPALTVTATLTDSKTYGDVYTFPGAVVGTNYTVSGFVDASALGGVFTQDTAANIGLTGAPVFSSAGAPATATVVGSPYLVDIAVGTLSNTAGYTFDTFASGGALAVTPRALTITANNQSKVYGDSFTFAGTEFAALGLINGDTVSRVSLSSSGAAARANVAGSPYAIAVGGATGAGMENYTVEYVGGSMRVVPRRVTVAARGGRLVAGRAPRNPGLRASNLASFDTVSALRGLRNRLNVNRRTRVGTYATRVVGRLSNPNYVVVKRNRGTWRVAGRSSGTRAPMSPRGLGNKSRSQSPVSAPVVSLAIPGQTSFLSEEPVEEIVSGAAIEESPTGISF